MRTRCLLLVSLFYQLMDNFSNNHSSICKPKQMKRLIEPCRHSALKQNSSFVYLEVRFYTASTEFDFPRLRTFTIQLETLMSLLNMRKPFSRIHTMDAKHLAHVVSFAERWRFLNVVYVIIRQSKERLYVPIQVVTLKPNTILGGLSAVISKRNL